MVINQICIVRSPGVRVHMNVLRYLSPVGSKTITEKVLYVVIFRADLTC